MSEGAAIAELAKCLNLCVPSGMSEDEREVWLYGAFDHLSEHKIPAKPFASAAFKARNLCDHPAKIVPTIIRESKEWADSLRSVENTKRKLYENANAPRLRQQEEVLPDEDREAIAAMLKETTGALKSVA